MIHNIPTNLIDSLTQGPSAAKLSSVANLQNYIRDLLGESHHTFLQGSYRNDTAISDINDVDIIAIRKATYSGSFSRHPVSSLVSWGEIFGEIEQKLQQQSKYT